MEFPFPPQPPGYDTVQTARSILAVWAFAGGMILAYRIRRWRFLRWYELVLWVVAFWINVVLLADARCRFTGYDDVSWLKIAPTVSMIVSVAGIIVCLAHKLASLPTRLRRRVIRTTVLLGTPCSIWLLAPGLGHPRELFDRSQCRNNLGLIGLAFSNYESEHHLFPPSASLGTEVSWRVAILPYLEQDRLFTRYDRDQPWTNPTNIAIATERIDSLICRSNYHAQQDGLGRWYTAYSMPTGANTVGANPHGTSIKEISDGTSNTALAMEACGAQLVWTEPRDINVDQMPAGINLKGTSSGHSDGWMSSYHLHTVHVLLADGSVRSLSTDTNPDVLRKLVSIAGE